MNPFPTSNLLLKHQPELFQTILTKKLKPLQVIELLGLSVVGLALFGGIMSMIIPHWWHAFNLMWKMIVLIFGSYALCLPALYVFSSIRGSRLTFRQLILFLLASIATTAVVLLALSPIAWFFTWSTDHNLEVIRVMNGLMIGFGIVFGIILLARSFYAGYKHHKAEDPNSKSASDILLLWLILVIAVTVQMSQKLGPWYRESVSGEVCIGSECFPDVAQGEFLTAPTITDVAAGTVSWSIPEERCNLDDLRYVSSGHGIGYASAVCYPVNGHWNCTAQLKDHLLDAPSGSTVQVQTHNECANQQYVSPAVTYTKP